MALPASAILPSTSKFQIKLCKNQALQLHRCALLDARPRVSPICMKVTMAQFGEPNKVKLQLGIVRERLWEIIPDSVKDLPWKKAENVLLQRLLFLGRKALKWSLITLFIFSSLSDVMVSISRNQELMIPFGLLAGCLITDFLRETSQEVFRGSKEKGLTRQLLGISCSFVLVKCICAYFAVQSRVFLLHVANGGLMQVLWLWRGIANKNDEGRGKNSIWGQDTSLAMGAEE